MNGQQLLWHLRRHGLEWAPRLALGLLAATGIFWLAVLLPLQQRVADAARSQQAQRDGMLRRADINQAGDPQERLARFYAFFDEGGSLASKLERLEAAARASGLVLYRAEYRMLAPSDQKLARYQIILPVEGSYRTIRSFASQALETIPALALSQIKFQRRRISEGTAEAQIIFTLYLRP
jgi:hypothetical protein